MKSLVSRILCLTLALSVFCGSVGMATARHICLISGKVMKPLAKEKGDGCCKKKKKAPAGNKLAFKKKCCELSVAHYKVSPETGNSFSSVKLPVLFTSTLIRFIPELVFFYNPQKLFASGFNKAPPFAGRLLLIFIQLLRI